LLRGAVCGEVVRHVWEEVLLTKYPRTYHSTA
jgi:hypothetical protein